MNAPQPSPSPLLLWAIWLFLFSGCIGYPFLLGGGWPAGENVDDSLPLFIVLFAYGSILTSCAIRWILLPRLKQFTLLFPSAIAGMALAESLVFLGLFLVGSDYPQTQQQFYLFGIFGVAQYIPIYTQNLSNK